MPDTSPVDYEFGELIPISDISAALPPLPNGEKYAQSTVYRWLNLDSQNRSTLCSVQIGRHRYTTKKWMRDFFENTRPAIALPRTPTQRERGRAAAKRKLAASGI